MTVFLVDELAAEIPEGACGIHSRIHGWCDQEPVISVVVGCVHEHLSHKSACQHHAEPLAKGLVMCRHCFCADGHRCEMHLLRATPLPNS